MRKKMIKGEGMFRFIGKRAASIICFFILLTARGFAEEGGGSIQFVIGVDVMPRVEWSFPSLLNPHGTDEMDYDMEATGFTSYSTNVRFKKINATLGLNAVVEDDFVGDVDQFAGYVAVKNIFFRYSLGKIRGTGKWTGTDNVLPRSFEYDHDVKSYEINYMFGKKDGESPDMNMGWYAGIGYAALTVPIEIHTLTTPGGKENQVYGVPVYDDAYEVKAYCAQFGFDTMMGDMAGGNVKPGTVKFFGHGQDTLGFGSGEISPESVAYAETLNPGRTFVDRKSFVGYLQNDTTMGVYWAPSILGGHGVLALGYNINFSMVVTFEGAAEEATELGYDASFGTFRHGPQFRVYATW
jgi:hypothetical protein